MSTGIPFPRPLVVLLAGAVAAITLASTLPDRAAWLGSWGESGAALEASTLLSYPVVASFAVWIASAPQRNGYLPLLQASSRRTIVPWVRLALAVGVVGAAGLAVGAAVVGLLTARQATYGSPPVLELAVAAAGFVTAAGVGVLLARTVPVFVAAPLAAFGVYLVEVFIDTTNPRFQIFASMLVADDRERTYRESLDWVLVIRGAWLLALAILAIALAARSRTWSTWFAVTCMIATPLLIVGPDGMQLRPEATRAECSETGRFTVCLSAARAHTKREVENALADLTSSLDGLFPADTLFVEQGVDAASLDRKAAEAELIVSITVSNGVHGEAHVLDRNAMLVQVSTALLRAECAPIEAEPDAPADEGEGEGEMVKPKAGAADVLQDWLFREYDVPEEDVMRYGGPPTSSAWLDWSDAEAFRRRWLQDSAVERRQWLSEHRSELLSCTQGLPT